MSRGRAGHPGSRRVDGRITSVLGGPRGGREVSMSSVWRRPTVVGVVVVLAAIVAGEGAPGNQRCHCRRTRVPLEPGPDDHRDVTVHTGSHSCRERGPRSTRTSSPRPGPIVVDRSSGTITLVSTLSSSTGRRLRARTMTSHNPTHDNEHRERSESPRTTDPRGRLLMRDPDRDSVSLTVSLACRHGSSSRCAW